MPELREACIDLYRLDPLISKGEKMERNGNSKNSDALSWASMTGDNARVKTLLAQGANVNRKDNYGLTALWVASCMGCYDCMKTLLKHGAHVNHRDNSGDTVLHTAVQSCQVQAVKLLLDHHADIQACNGSKKSVLHYAVDGDETNETFGLIILLLRNGVPVNNRDKVGDTALHVAARDGKLYIADIILQFKADPTIPNNQGKTPLDVSDESIKYDFELLLKKAAEKLEDETRNENLLIRSQSDCHLRRTITVLTNDVTNLSNKVTHLTAQHAELERELRTMKRNVTAMMCSRGNLPANMIDRGWLAPEQRRLFDRIDENRDTVIEFMKDLSGVIARLHTKLVITGEQCQELDSMTTDSEKVRYLLGLINHGPLYLEGLREALEHTNQKNIAQLLK